MKIAVISCIHGNLAALKAVLADIDQQGVEQTFCLGDLVGYGPYPNEVVAMIRDRQIPTCQGCWDEDIIDGLNACECSYPSLLAEKRGRLAHEWTDAEVTAETREYLAQMPLALRHENLCFVHGSPQSQHEYLLPETSAFIALERVLSTGADILFCGHTHVPYVRTLSDGQLQIRVVNGAESASKNTPQSILKKLPEQHSQTLTAPLKRIVNAGSVGEPRHGKPQATYVIYDTLSEQTIFREVDYDYAQTCAAIINKGLPPIFSWRLSQGLEFAEKADDPTHVCER
ncbi:metallophosphoesterase family protein [Leptolyngbya sp. BC1307]|uniref:metallophosphoesterase family protein n=1 Tax=Leptolyngbya sp. BC1307 TaxID=2029589 RepID=UPI000EFB89CC|nr:metallophosphoesterase family protein [Leptolyngbya sp. BC1307]